MQERYLQADRIRRGHLLDEMETITGLHCKSLIRLMKGNLTRKSRRRQRGRVYGPEVDDALVIAGSTDYICPECLAPNLTWLAKHLAAHGELPFCLSRFSCRPRFYHSTTEWVTSIERMRILGQDTRQSG